jgi:hypothetical protein
MTIQPNAYELNKLYRLEQEARSEKQRQVEELLAKPEKTAPAILVIVQLLSIFK